MAKQRRPRVPMEEQIRLITECRRSGMTDADWCRSQGISVSTFYNWVTRCRKQEVARIPAPSYGHSDTPVSKQDIVPVSIVQEPTDPMLMKPVSSSADVDRSSSCTIEVTVQDFSVRIHNDADPMLLARTFQILKGLSC